MRPGAQGFLQSGLSAGWIPILITGTGEEVMAFYVLGLSFDGGGEELFGEPPSFFLQRQHAEIVQSPRVAGVEIDGLAVEQFGPGEKPGFSRIIRCHAVTVSQPKIAERKIDVRVIGHIRIGSFEILLGSIQIPGGGRTNAGLIVIK